MKEFVIRPLDVLSIISRRRKPMLTTFLLTYLAVMVVYKFIPRSYQSEAVLVIGVNYFQNPLIGDLVSQTHDPGELRTEREKIIKASLGIEFANKMGDQYGLFDSPLGAAARSVEVERFLKDLEIHPVSSAEFQIKYRAARPDIADGVVNAALDSIREHMYANRIQTLEKFFGVLGDEILETADNSNSTAKLTNSGTKNDTMRAQVTGQIETLTKRLEDLHRNYNDEHPAVRAVQVEINELRDIENSGGLSANLTRRKVFRSTPPGSSQNTIRDDLTKQKHLVNISLEMERKDPTMSAYLALTKEPVFPEKPVFPKLRLFLLFGLVTSMMFATFMAALVEFWHRTEIKAIEFSKKLEIEHLGTLYLHKEKRN